jgi:vacuolar-type H+-ATPase subunit E/Vma4
MPLGDILEAIRSEADRAAAVALAEATAQAEELVGQARRDGAAEEQQLADGRRDATRIACSRVTSRAHLDAAHTRRAAREDVYQALAQLAAGGLQRLRHTAGYPGLLERLFEEAYAVLPDASLALTDPADVATVERIVAARGRAVRVEGSAPGWGGLVLVADGRLVRNDLHARFDKADDHLRRIAATLVPALGGKPP